MSLETETTQIAQDAVKIEQEVVVEGETLAAGFAQAATAWPYWVPALVLAAILGHLV